MSAIAPRRVLRSVTATGVFEPQDRHDPNFAKVSQPFGNADSIACYIRSTSTATIQIRVGPDVNDITTFPPAVVQTIIFAGSGQDIVEVTIAAPYLDYNVTAVAGTLHGFAWGTYTPGG